MLRHKNVWISIAMVACSAAFVGGCSKPFHLWQADITATPKPQSFDVNALARERVVMLAPAAYNHLQGFVPAVSQGLTVACSEVSPPILVLSQYETVNKLSQEGLSADYGEEKPDYAPGVIPDRRRLQRLHKALAVKYVLQSGLAQFTESTEDRFEFAGIVLIKTRVNSLYLWMRLWDAETGDFLWEGSGEGIVAATLFEEKSTLPLFDISRRLWMLMLQETPLAGKTRAVVTSEEHIFSGNSSGKNSP